MSYWNRVPRCLSCYQDRKLGPDELCRTCRRKLRRSGKHSKGKRAQRAGRKPQ